MARTRISTTVDQDRLAACRRLFEGTTDSVVIDAGLAALVREVEGRAEVEALLRQPYDIDPDLAWLPPDGADLPCDGQVPEHVLALARERRARDEH